MGHDAVDCSRAFTNDRRERRYAVSITAQIPDGEPEEQKAEEDSRVPGPPGFVRGVRTDVGVAAGRRGKTKMRVYF